MRLLAPSIAVLWLFACATAPVLADKAAVEEQNDIDDVDVSKLPVEHRGGADIEIPLDETVAPKAPQGGLDSKKLPPPPPPPAVIITPNGNKVPKRRPPHLSPPIAHRLRPKVIPGLKLKPPRQRHPYLAKPKVPQRAPRPLPPRPVLQKGRKPVILPPKPKFVLKPPVGEPQKKKPLRPVPNPAKTPKAIDIKAIKKEEVVVAKETPAKELKEKKEDKTGEKKTKKDDPPRRRDSHGHAPVRKPVYTPPKPAYQPAAPSYNPPVAAQPQVIIKQAGPSKQYGWIGHGSYAPFGIPNPFPSSLNTKWNPSVDDLFEAGLLYPAAPSSAPASSYSAPAPKKPAPPPPPPPATYSAPAPAPVTYSSPAPAPAAYSPPAPAPSTYSPPAPAATSYNAAPAPSTYNKPFTAFSKPAAPAPSPAPSSYSSAPAPAPSSYSSAPAPAPSSYSSAPAPAPATYSNRPFTAFASSPPAPAPSSYSNSPAPSPAPSGYNKPFTAFAPAPAPSNYNSVPAPAPSNYNNAPAPAPAPAPTNNPFTSAPSSTFTDTIYYNNVAPSAPAKAPAAPAPAPASINYAAQGSTDSFRSVPAVPAKDGNAPVFVDGNDNGDSYAKRPLTVYDPATKSFVPASGAQQGFGVDLRTAEDTQSVSLFDVPIRVEETFENSQVHTRQADFFKDVPVEDDDAEEPVSQADLIRDAIFRENLPQSTVDFGAEPEVFYIFYENEEDPAPVEVYAGAPPVDEQATSSSIPSSSVVAPPRGDQNLFTPPSADEIRTIYVPLENAVNVPQQFSLDVGTSFGYSGKKKTKSQNTLLNSAKKATNPNAARKPTPEPSFATYPSGLSTQATPSYDNPISSYDAPIIKDNSYSEQPDFTDEKFVGKAGHGRVRKVRKSKPGVVNVENKLEELADTPLFYPAPNLASAPYGTRLEARKPYGILES